MSYFNGITIKDGANLDAFSRLRTSHPETLFATQNQYDLDTLMYETGATGTGAAATHSANTRMVAISCGAGTGTAFIQSYDYIPYQPGKSQLILITGVLGAAVADAVVDVGLFDASNGIFLRQNGTSGYEIVRRTKTSGTVEDTTVTQANWNIDKMNGTGVSGITLDPAACYILIIDAQFLGMGRVRVGFDVGGRIYYVHQFLNANSLAVPYVQSLALPIQCLVTATATGSTKTTHFKCAAVSSEGGREDDLAYPFATPELTVSAGSGARTHLISVRSATTFNSIANRSHLHVSSVELCVTGNYPILWELCVGTTFSAGPTWAAVNATYSATEYTSVVGTYSAAGIVIAAGYVAASNQNTGALTRRMTQRFPLGLDRAGAVRANGTVSLLVTGLGGASACRGVICYEEVR